jgi:hypothetical protein
MIMVMPADAAIVAGAQAAFPTVTVHTLNEEYMSTNVFRVTDPTLILIIDGIYGDTEDDLSGMGVPYDIMSRAAFTAILWLPSTTM